MSEENVRFDGYLMPAARLTPPLSSERLALPAVAGFAD
jgi:hypothetical protein